MPALPVTSLTAAILAVALIPLSIFVSLHRIKTGITSGDGGDEILKTRIRTQGNFIEYAPMGLIVMVLLEARGGNVTLLCSVATLLVVGRMAHAAGMLTGKMPLRAVGMIATYLSLLIGAAMLIVTQFQV